ncbi:MAG: carboxypeptidase regulatory-like domain-containing protein [Saprospiraceae bacterium]|nr:carboxypeptidase regulatory-like domain-containing protein [Saprospiraceae bacterium]
MDKNNIRALIAKNQLDEAIEAMRQMAVGTRHENEVLLLSSRYQAIERERRLGVKSTSEINLTNNQITQALLELINDLPDGASVSITVSKPPSQNTGNGNTPPPPTGTDNGNPPDDDGGTGKNGNDQIAGNMTMAFWFAVAAFVVLLAITLFIPGWAADNNALFRTLLALAAGGIAVTLPGFLQLNWGNVAKAGGSVAAFLLVFLFNPANEKSTPVSLRVYVEKSGGGWPSLPFSDKAAVKIIFPSGPKSARLLDGQAEFPGTSPEDMKQPIRIRLENSEPFAADSTVDVKGKNSVNLLARAIGLGTVSGQAFDEKNNPVVGVIFRVEGMADTTDINGLFNFSIPENMQNDRYRLIGSKNGYKPWDNFVNPTNTRFRVDMVKVKK